MRHHSNIFILMAALLVSAMACSKPEPPAYLEEEDETPGATKEFYVYDAMSYDGKPDLKADMISPITLIYEAFLLGDDGELDDEKIQTQIDLAKATGVNTISTDIEAWYSSKSGAEMKAGFTTLFDRFKEAIPGCNVGNYGLPVSDLNILRHNPNMVGKTEEELIARWKSGSQKRMEAAEISDVLYPSLYAMNPDIDQYIADLDVTVNYIRENFPDKKIVGYLWPQYYNLENNEYYQQFMTTDVWMKMLEACYERLDGVVIWSHGKGENGEDVAWTDSRVQDIYNTTKQFISNHAANIKLDTFDQSGDITREPSEFYVYESLNFTNTPDDLLKFGLQPINYVREAVLSEKDPDILAPGEPNPPVLSRITKLGESVTRPVLINQNTWIRDRSSNNAAMVERFKSVYETFHDANDLTTIGYMAVGPTSLTSLLLGNYETEFARKDSWLRYAVEPTRVLRQYADILYLDVVMVNDDIELWKSDTRTVLEEARNGLPAGKKIYACLGAVYNHRKADFPKAYQPVDEDILLEAMEFLYLRCDGIVLIGNCPDTDPISYSENISVMKAAKTFYENHKTIIDKTLPDEPIIGTEIPEFSDEDLPPVELREEILNGGFEEEITPHSTSKEVHTNSLVRPLRLAGFFNTTAMTTFPDAAAGTTVPDGTWFHRCNNNSWFWFTYIDDTELQYTGGGTPIAHTGTKSAVVYTAFGATSHYADHKDNMEHLFSLAQTLSLDDTKTYKLTFWYNRPALVWGTSNVAANQNNIEEMKVGIVSSTGATNTTDTTYEETITLDKSGNWVECSVTFDLPKIISENPGISFGKCAIHFNPVPVLNESGQTVKCLVNIDDVSLTVVE